MEISTSSIAAFLLKEHISTQVEEFWVMALASNLKLISMVMLFRGTADKCLVHPRDVIKFACLQNATHIIIAHSHPSHDLNPSTDDIKFTKKLYEVLKVVEIDLIDHLIITEKGFSSIRFQHNTKKIFN